MQSSSETSGELRRMVYVTLITFVLFASVNARFPIRITPDEVVPASPHYVPPKLPVNAPQGRPNAVPKEQVIKNNVGSLEEALKQGVQVGTELAKAILATDEATRLKGEFDCCLYARSICTIC